MILALQSDKKIIFTVAHYTIKTIKTDEKGGTWTYFVEEMNHNYGKFKEIALIN